MATRKGFVTFFLNINEHNKHVPVDEYINIMKSHNQAAVEAMTEEGYICVFVPCYDEACRVEKRNFVNDTRKVEEDADDSDKPKKIKDKE